MKKFILGLLFALAVLFIYVKITDSLEEKESITHASSLIEKEIKNVSKLVVSEGTYAKVYNYNNREKFVFDFLSARKKALIVVNAKASVIYDLRQMEYQVDAENKIVSILKIPKAELEINPDIQYYDVTQDYLNQFEAEDYNKIKKYIEKDLKKKISNSVLMSNAENRLLSELQKLFILTNSMGWTLQYNQQNLNSSEEIERLKL